MSGVVKAGNRRTWAVWSARHQAGLSFPCPHLLGDSLDTSNDFVSARVVSRDRAVWGDDEVLEMVGMVVDNIVSEEGEFYVVYYFTTSFRIILHIKLTI